MKDDLKDKIEDIIYELQLMSKNDENEKIMEELRLSIKTLTVIAEYKPENRNGMETDCSLFEFETVGNTLSIKKYIGFDDESIVIPLQYAGKRITRISTGAFKNRKHLKCVRLSDNIQAIGSGAFEECTALEIVQTTSSVTYIGERAFFGCGALQDIGSLNSLERVGKEAFARTAITSFVVPQCVKYLAYKLFEGCQKLKSIILHETIQIIGKECFSGCSALVNIAIPESVSHVGAEAFKNCTAIRDFAIHSVNTKWGKNVFSRIEVWRPDLRYNPRYIYHPLKDINVLCHPGSSVQVYCTENNIRCSRLRADLKKAKCVAYPLDSIVGFSMIKPTYREARQLFEILTNCLAQFNINTVTEETRFEQTGSEYINIHIIGEPITDVKEFRKAVTNQANCFQYLQGRLGQKIIQFLFEKERITLGQEISNSIW